MCKKRSFKRQRYCDNCDETIEIGQCCHSCKVCDYDLCDLCNALPAPIDAPIEVVEPQIPASTVPNIAGSASSPQAAIPIVTIHVSSTSPPKPPAHPFFSLTRSLTMGSDNARPNFHMIARLITAVPAILTASATASEANLPSANASSPPTTFQATSALIANPRSRSRLKLPKATAVVSFSATALAEVLPQTPQVQTPQVPPSVAIFRSLLASLIIIIDTVDAPTRNQLKDELMQKFDPYFTLFPFID